MERVHSVDSSPFVKMLTQPSGMSKLSAPNREAALLLANLTDPQKMTGIRIKSDNIGVAAQ